MAMKDLIERLEKATGPDREIDARIAYAVKPALVRMGSLEEWLQTEAAGRVLNYTWSIDDAIMLVPNGLHWSLNDRSEARVGGPAGGYMLKGGEHKTPAVALCIAALKARTAVND